MKAIIGQSVAVGTIVAPPSKSMAHRMLIGAGLAHGKSVVRNIELSEDVKATLEILEALGAEYSIHDDEVTIHGIGGKNMKTSHVLNSRESGSTLRFFIPLLLTSGNSCEFVGAKRLFERPLGIYEEICKKQGILFDKEEASLKLAGQLQATDYKVPGDVSSQFITGLLFALPLLKEDSTLEILPPIESKAYIELTLEALEIFGIIIKRVGNTYYIPGGQVYQPKEVIVEGDYSNAAFLESFNLVQGNVKVDGLNSNSKQGDKVYQSYFTALKQGTPTLDISECPDLGPILMGMAAVCNGARFTGTRRLRIKESDRGAVMAEELAKFGICVTVKENEIEVHKGMLKKPTALLESHNDHRIAMTLSVLLSSVGGEIDGAEAVRKSYPSFYEDLKKLGIIVDII